MLTLQETIPELMPGDFMSREEFLHRWEAMPNLKFAELIGGIVYMPSPVGIDHSENDWGFAGLLYYYAANTPGCRGGSNATWLMGHDAPQPDSFLRIKEDFGGHSRREGKFIAGAPEFVVEVGNSSASYDLHQKLELYEASGVDEYLVALPLERTVRWFRRIEGAFEEMDLPADGIIKSHIFPGSWINYQAVMNGNDTEALRVIQEWIATAEHAEFVKQLTSCRQ